MKLECAECGKTFEKPDNEYRRRVKRGAKDFFCSKSCSNAHGNRVSPRGPRAKNLVANNRRDEFTPFRWFLLRAKARRHLGRTDLDLSYLSNLWEEQKGCCPFAGQKMILPENTNGWPQKSPMNASLDRIDGGKGYVKGNVRFVSVMANLARGEFSDEDVIGFCRMVFENKMGE